MIDWFMGGKPKKKSKDPLRELMAMPGSIIGDRKTKPQRRAIKRNPFGDWDGDRVINGLDCQPKNKKKHAYHHEPNNEQDIDEYVSDRFRDRDEYPKKVRLYHGTRTGNVNKINTEGLKPQSQTGNRNYSGIAPKYKDKVFMTQNKSNAMYWALQNKNEGEAIIIEADVPFEEYKKGLKRYKERYEDDPMVRDEFRDEVIVESISPEDIKKIRPYSNAIIEKELRTDPWQHGNLAKERERENSNVGFNKLFNKEETK